MVWHLEGLFPYGRLIAALVVAAAAAEKGANTGQVVAQPLVRLDIRASRVQPGGTDLDVFAVVTPSDKGTVPLPRPSPATSRKTTGSIRATL